MQYGQTISAEWPDDSIDKAIKLFDLDRDGELSSIEFLAAVRALRERVPPKSPPLKRLFALMDTDGDGYIGGTESDAVAGALKVGCRRYCLSGRPLRRCPSAADLAAYGFARVPAAKRRRLVGRDVGARSECDES